MNDDIEKYLQYFVFYNNLSNKQKIIFRDSVNQIMFNIIDRYTKEILTDDIKNIPICNNIEDKIKNESCVAENFILNSEFYGNYKLYDYIIFTHNGLRIKGNYDDDKTKDEKSLSFEKGKSLLFELNYLNDNIYEELNFFINKYNVEATQKTIIYTGLVVASYFTLVAFFSRKF